MPVGQPHPTALGLFGDAVDVRGASNITCARLPGGSVACVGVDAGATRRAPMTIPGLRDVAELAVGATSACARTTDGAVWCWGRDSNGQLGTPYLNDADWKPNRVSIPPAKAIFAGGQTVCAIDLGEQARCWGEYSFDGPKSAFSGSQVRRIGVGGNEGGIQPCAIRLDGRVVCEGPLSTAGHRSTTELSSIRDAVEISLGHDHGCALSGTGDLSCWGEGSDGQLGDGLLHPAGERVDPVRVPGTFKGAHLGEGLGSTHSCLLGADGWPRCWGANASGELGDGSRERRLVPTRVAAP